MNIEIFVEKNGKCKIKFIFKKIDVEKKQNVKWVFVPK